MKRLVSGRMTRNLLVPGWITTFGLVALSAPPVGVAASVSLFVVGVAMVPALLMMSSPAGRQRAAARRPTVPVSRFRVAFWRVALRG